MSEITEEKWNEVVQNSPYVFPTDEVGSCAQEVELYALDESGGLDESRPMGTTFIPNLYFEDSDSLFKYFVSRTAFSADVNDIGEFNYSIYDYDTDYPELESTGFGVSDLEELEMFMEMVIPEKEYLKLEKAKELEE